MPTLPTSSYSPSRSVVVVLAVIGCWAHAGCSDDASSAADAADAADAVDRDAASDGDATIEADAPADPSLDETPEGYFGLPWVPLAGWANSVADSDVLAALEPEGQEPIENLAPDPDAAVGEPELSIIGIVAIGVVGNYITLDLGESEMAHDGDGDDLVVLELGVEMSGTPEPYRVLVSNQPEGDWTEVAVGLGEQSFDLAGLDVAPVRYVRIEAMSEVEAVLGGAGSPAFPGAEIDAVGAVYPGPAE